MQARIPCVCPPKADGQSAHDHDTITFRERLDFRAGLTIRKAIGIAKEEDDQTDAAEILAILTEHYLIHGIESWSLTTMDKSKRVPLEPDRPAIRAFLADHPEEAMEAGNAADDLYMEQVLLPLLQRASTLSQDLPTTDSTSQKSGSQEKPPKPSRRSSTSITPTDGTATITSLHDGGSKSSRSSASVA